MGISLIDAFLDTRIANEIRKFADSQKNIPGIVEKSRSGEEYTSPSLSAFLVAYNPETITDDTFNKMRKHPQIHAGLMTIELPLLSTNVWVQCEDVDIKNFVEVVIKKLWCKLIKTSIRGGLVFGRAPHEKVWMKDVVRYSVMAENGTPESRQKEGWVYKKIKDLYPPRVTIHADGLGNFDGLTQDVGTNAISIDAKKSFLYTHDQEFGSLYGNSRIKYAYDPWYWSMIIYQFCNKYYERKGEPPIKARGTAGISRDPVSGIEKDGLAETLKMAKSLNSKKIVALSNEQLTDGKFAWDMEYMMDDKRGEMFIAYIEHLLKMMLIGIYAQEKAISQSSDVGSYAMTKSQLGWFIYTLEALLKDVVDFVNRYLIPDLVLYNFGAAAPRALVIPEGLSEEKKELVSTVVMEMVKSGQIPVSKRLVEYLSEQIGIPLTDPTDEIPTAKVAKVAELKDTRETIRLTDNATPQHWHRDLSQWEQKVSFSDIKEKYNTAEAHFVTQIGGILATQKDAYIKELKTALEAKDLAAVTTITLKGGAHVKAFLKGYIGDIADYGQKSIEKELGIQVVRKQATKIFLTGKVESLSNKILSDVQFDALTAAMEGIRREATDKEIIYGVKNAFDKYSEKKIPIAAGYLTPMVMNIAREDAAKQGAAQGAAVIRMIYSAILDDRICDLCSALDEQVFNADDPRVNDITPPLHENCRCLMVYVTEMERPENIPDVTFEGLNPELMRHKTL